MNELPTPIRFVCLAISLILALSAVAGIVLGIVGADYFLAGFELVVLVASGFGVWAGLGRLPGVETMTMVCLAGVVFVGALLGAPSIVAGLIQGGTGLKAEVAGLPLMPWIVGRLIASAVLAGLSAFVVLGRERSSLRYLLTGVIVGVPVIILAAALLLTPLRSYAASLAAPVQVFLALVGFFVIAALVSVSGHNLIRAFEVGIEAGLPARGDHSAGPKKPVDGQSAGETSTSSKVSSETPQP